MHGSIDDTCMRVIDAEAHINQRVLQHIPAKLTGLGAIFSWPRYCLRMSSLHPVLSTQTYGSHVTTTNFSQAFRCSPRNQHRCQGVGLGITKAARATPLLL
jgi:hypothetical protein